MTPTAAIPTSKPQPHEALDDVEESGVLPLELFQLVPDRGRLDAVREQCRLDALGDFIRPLRIVDRDEIGRHVRLRVDWINGRSRRVEPEQAADLAVDDADDLDRHRLAAVGLLNLDRDRGEGLVVGGEPDQAESVGVGAEGILRGEGEGVDDGDVVAGAERFEDGLVALESLGPLLEEEVALGDETIAHPLDDVLLPVISAGDAERGLEAAGGDDPGRLEVAGIDPFVLEAGGKRCRVADRVGVRAVGADVPASVRLIAEKQIDEVLVDRRHHDEGEDDEAEHRDRHPGPALAGAGVGDRGPYRWQRAPEQPADAADPGQEEIEIVDNQDRGAGNHEDAGEKEHLEVAVELTEEGFLDVARQQPQHQQVDTDQAEDRPRRDAEESERERYPERHQAHPGVEAKLTGRRLAEERQRGPNH